MTDWQPIETAPKDGTVFDAWSVTTRYNQPWSEERIVNVYWHKTEWATDDGGVEGISQNGQFSGRITHWMPLPSPPAGYRT